MSQLFGIRFRALCCCALEVHQFEAQLAVLEVNMSKQKFKRYTVDFIYEYADTGEDVLNRVEVVASSKSEAVIKAVNLYTDDFSVSRVVRENLEVSDEV